MTREDLYSISMQLRLTRKEIYDRLVLLGARLRPELEMELLIVGGAAGMLMNDFGPRRTTIDCDVIRYIPPQIQEEIEQAAKALAAENGWASDWFNSKVMALDVLPAGWRSRRRLVGKFGPITIFAIGRLDLLATKFFANRPQDRDDIRELQPTEDELYFVRRYLEQMRLPSRGANLDELQWALNSLAAFEKEVRSRGEE